ncbi:MAG TPA: hypothetical protein VHZ51_00100 [Ktedonobacteraceae bacterium]|nr:hypothetical protein [Ktedonobacteraceae bacterium]
MADTPLTNLVQPFCSSLSSLAGEIQGITGKYQGANEKLQKDSRSLVTQGAGEVGFYGLGASAFYGSVKNNTTDALDQMNTLHGLSQAATTCHNALNDISKQFDGELQNADSSTSYRDDIAIVYGSASYPYTYLLGIAETLDIKSVIQSGMGAVTSAFQGAAAFLVAQAQPGSHAHDPKYQQHVRNAVAGATGLAAQIQGICGRWAEQVHSDVAIFNTAIVGRASSFAIKGKRSGLYTYDRAASKGGKHAKPEGGKHAAKKDRKLAGWSIGPSWQGDAYQKTLSQNQGTWGSDTTTFTGGDYNFGANFGQGKDGFNAGIGGGADLFSITNQAVLGSQQLGLAGSGNVMGPEVHGQLGIRNSSIGADIGGSLISATGSAGVDIAGQNIGVNATVGLKAELGFEIGKHTEIKLPFVSIGFNF